MWETESLGSIRLTPESQVHIVMRMETFLHVHYRTPTGLVLR